MGFNMISILPNNDVKLKKLFCEQNNIEYKNCLELIEAYDGDKSSGYIIYEILDCDLNIYCINLLNEYDEKLADGLIRSVLSIAARKCVLYSNIYSYQYENLLITLGFEKNDTKFFAPIHKILTKCQNCK
jgi:hypothetical protein